MENLFRSARLTYRAIEDTNTDEDFMHRIQSDVDAFANSTSSLLKPESRVESRKFKEFVARQLIGVIICLPPSHPGTDPTPIGCVYLTAIKPGEEHHRHAYISIDIVRPYQRLGYGAEAINWVLDWGFQIAGLHRIGIECYSYNNGAQALYERLGFVFEGRKRQLLWFNGGWHDYLSFSMLEDEWRALRQRQATSTGSAVSAT